MVVKVDRGGLDRRRTSPAPQRAFEERPSFDGLWWGRVRWEAAPKLERRTLSLNQEEDHPVWLKPHDRSANC